MLANLLSRIAVLALLVCASLAHSDYDPETGRDNGLTSKSPLNREEFVKAWDNGDFFQMGPAYDRLFERDTPFVADVNSYLTKLAEQNWDNYGKVNPRYSFWNSDNDIRSGHVRIVLVEATAPNAYVRQLYQAGSGISTSEPHKLVPYEVFKEIFRDMDKNSRSHAGHLIVMNDELLQILTEGEAAWILAHEQGHIRNRDTERGYAGQSGELKADKVATHSIAGRYPLSVALSAWHKMFQWEKKYRPDKNDLSLGQSLLSTHPDQGVRYTALQKEIEELRARGLDAKAVDRPLNIDVALLRARESKIPWKAPAPMLDTQTALSFFPLFLDPAALSKPLKKNWMEIASHSWELEEWRRQNKKKLTAQSIAFLLETWFNLLDEPAATIGKIGSSPNLEIVKTWSSADKVNQTLRLFSFLDDARKQIFAKENSSLQKSLVDFLARHTGRGRTQFNAATFVEPFSADYSEANTWMRKFWFEKEGDADHGMAALVSLKPEWQKLLNQVVFTGYSQILEWNREAPEGAVLAPSLQVVLLHRVAQQHTELLKSANSAKTHDLVVDSDRMMTYLKILKERKISQGFIKPDVIAGLVVNRLKSENKPISVDDWFSIMSMHESYRFTPNQVADLFQVLLGQVDSFAGKSVGNDRMFGVNFYYAQLWRDWLAQNPLSANQRLKFLKFFDAYLRPDRPGYDVASADWIVELRKFFAQVSVGDILRYTGHLNAEDQKSLNEKIRRGLDKDKDQGFIAATTTRGLSQWNILGLRLMQDSRTLDGMSAQDLEKYLAWFALQDRLNEQVGNSWKFHISIYSGYFILAMLEKFEASMPAAEWAAKIGLFCTRTFDFEKDFRTLPEEFRERLSNLIVKRLKDEKPETIKAFLETGERSSGSTTQFLMSDADLGALVGHYVKAAMATGKSPSEALTALDKESKLSALRLRAWGYGQSNAAEYTQAQPDATKEYGATGVGMWEGIAGKDILVRLSSEIGANLRALPQADLLQALDYLMGHVEHHPKSTKIGPNIYQNFAATWNFPTRVYELLQPILC